MHKIVPMLFCAVPLAFVGACSTTETEIAPSTASSATTEQALLLEPGQNVLLIIEEGPGSQIEGSQGLGRFVHNYRGPGQRFGPAPIVEHTPNSLTFQTRTTTCTMRSGGSLTCGNGDMGRWEITNLPIPGGE